METGRGRAVTPLTGHAEVSTFAEALARVIHNARGRLLFGTEAQLQQACAELFAAERFDAAAQQQLGPGERPDFMIGGLAVELKVKGTADALTRQLRRYAAHDEVRGIVVVTSRARHRGIPREISGKPVRVVWLSGAAT